MRRNEVSKLASSDRADGKCDRGLYIEEHRQQRAGLFLKDVAYRLHAEFEVVDGSRHVHRYPELRGSLPVEPEESQPENPVKYLSMFQRRARKGQCFSQPYLGCREFSADFEYVEDAEVAAQTEPAINASSDLGWMLYDIDFNDDMKPGFFRAEMKSGVIVLTGVEVRR